MDIETLHTIAIYCFEQIRSNCEFLKIYSYAEEVDENYSFYELFKCERRVMVKKVILAPDGKCSERTLLACSESNSPVFLRREDGSTLIKINNSGKQKV